MKKLRKQVQAQLPQATKAGIKQVLEKADEINVDDELVTLSAKKSSKKSKYIKNNKVLCGSRPSARPFRPPKGAVWNTSAPQNVEALGGGAEVDLKNNIKT